MAVFANALLTPRGNKLNVTGTDLEVELGATSTVSVWQPGDVTAPGRGYLPKSSPASWAATDCLRFR